MTLTAIFALAVALAMDAFAVAVATGVRLGKVRRIQAFRMAFAFGLFQFLMPVAGWVLGLTLRDFIENWDHWLAFALLSFIGINMLREGFSKEDDKTDGEKDGPPAKTAADPTRGMPLFMLAVATSVDALAVGLSFSVLKISVWFPAAVIGVVCALITLAGLFLGKTLARAEVLGKRAELLGGVVLIGIGLKILYEHGVFGML